MRASAPLGGIVKSLGERGLRGCLLNSHVFPSGGLARTLRPHGGSAQRRLRAGGAWLDPSRFELVWPLAGNAAKLDDSRVRRGGVSGACVVRSRLGVLMLRGGGRRGRSGPEAVAMTHRLPMKSHRLLLGSGEESRPPGEMVQGALSRAEDRPRARPIGDWERGAVPFGVSPRPSRAMDGTEPSRRGRTRALYSIGSWLRDCGRRDRESGGGRRESAVFL